MYKFFIDEYYLIDSQPITYSLRMVEAVQSIMEAGSTVLGEYRRIHWSYRCTV